LEDLEALVDLEGLEHRLLLTNPLKWLSPPFQNQFQVGYLLATFVSQQIQRNLGTRNSVLSRGTGKNISSLDDN
jgi:hypothetical protein